MKEYPEHPVLFPSWRTMLPLGMLLAILWISILYADLASFRGPVSLRSAIALLKYIALSAAIAALPVSFIRTLKTIALRTCVIAFVLFLFFLSESLMADTVWNRWTRDTIQVGNGLITALDAYYTDHAVYPDVLVDLVPEYMESIPSLQYEYRFQGFNYTPSIQSYRLEFSVAGLTHCYYTTTDTPAMWHCSEIQG